MPSGFLRALYILTFNPCNNPMRLFPFYSEIIEEQTGVIVHPRSPSWKWQIPELNSDSLA